MTSAIQWIHFLRLFAVGIMSPVLTLSLIAHGAAIETVSLLIGVYSATVVIAEFPSGVFADLIGQKRMFLLSTVFGALCFALVLLSDSLLVLFPAMIANGLSRACSSGTLDALAVNQEQAHDDTKLLKITSRFSVLESAGLASGALIGGLTAGIGSAYAVNLSSVMVIYVALFVIGLLGIHEETSNIASAPRTSVRSRFFMQVSQSLTVVRHNATARFILVLSIAVGFALIAQEAYWQPIYAAFDPPSWSFGLVSFGGYCGVMLGARLITRFLRAHTKHVVSVYLLQRALYGVGLIALYFISREIAFIALYMLVYSFIGGSGVAENTLIHQIAKDELRSGILSFFSLIVQLGGILASIAGYCISQNGNYQLIWPLAGGLLILSAGALLFFPRQRQA